RLARKDRAPSGRPYGRGCGCDRECREQRPDAGRRRRGRDSRQGRAGDSAGMRPDWPDCTRRGGDYGCGRGPCAARNSRSEHAAGESTSQANLRAATRNSLMRANENSLKSIAFPAIGTGIAGFPIERCAQVMLEEVRAHLGGSTTLERIDFVLFDRPALEVFERVLAEMKD